MIIGKPILGGVTPFHPAKVHVAGELVVPETEGIGSLGVAKRGESAVEGEDGLTYVIDPSAVVGNFERVEPEVALGNVERRLRASVLAGIAEVRIDDEIGVTRSSCRGQHSGFGRKWRRAGRRPGGSACSAQALWIVILKGSMEYLPKM